MKIHEYQAREFFKKYGIPVSSGEVADSPDKAKKIAESIGKPVVVKAQVHVGGRGKAGGVKLAKTPEETYKVASTILGMDIKGLKVKKVLVAQAVRIESEAYLGVVVDRRSKRPVVMVSPAGGVEIEEVARETPEKIFKLIVDPAYGLLPHQARDLGYKLYRNPGLASKVGDVLMRLYRLFMETDASLAEINPFVVTKQGELLAIDSKINFDDNSLFRHPDYEELKDLTEDEKVEEEAKKKGLSFIKLEGDIGCVVNGAGLAMATMDVIKYFGGEPANFLDVGGSSNPEKVMNAMDIITREENVRVIWFNIFGGITRCDDIATGLVTALKNMEVNVPIVVRLTGTNEEEGRRLLKESGLTIHSVSTMSEGAKRSIGLAHRKGER
ncbi:ADP-forming succinate--CoA ligase subunit beta [candidate division WOR-3 bacterium]|nr:ADP-forming succinate--CoA ligase subunit beta [candidate division WOR-3 bacterium]